MFAAKAYFSLAEITDPTKHRAHNEWHQLDHIPENLILPGIVWNDRWVRSPDCMSASRTVAPSLASTHYGVMYWFREPIRETLDDFFMLSERSFQWGRSPQVRWTKRPMRGLFSPIKGYAGPRLPVTADILPFCPTKGVHITLSTVDPKAPGAHALFRWYDEVRIPDLLQCRGVAGAWTLAADDLFRHEWGEDSGPSWNFPDSNTRDPAAAPNRLTILYLDEDPLEFVADREARDVALRRAGRLRDVSDIEQVSFDSPLRAIVPWEWDWFEAAKFTG